jgi:hypothetical protein
LLFYALLRNVAYQFTATPQAPTKMTATLPASTADKIYKGTIDALTLFISEHINEATYAKDKQGHWITGQSAFCRTYGIDRSNLVKCLGGHREMSVGLYQRIAVALGKLDAAQATDEAVLLNLPLRVWLMMNHDALKNSIMVVNFQ